MFPREKKYPRQLRARAGDAGLSKSCISRDSPRKMVKNVQCIFGSFPCCAPQPSSGTRQPPATHGMLTAFLSLPAPHWTALALALLHLQEAKLSVLSRMRNQKIPGVRLMGRAAGLSENNNN